MSICYFNINRWKQSENRKISMIGDSDKEIAENTMNTLFKKNLYNFEGKLVLYEDEILPEIEKQYKNRKRFGSDYWSDCVNGDYTVYCVVEEMILSFDYFLKRAGKISEATKDYYFQMHSKENELPTELLMNLIFPDSQMSIRRKINNNALMHDIIVLEYLDINKWNKDDLNNLVRDDLVERIKKQLFSGKYSVKKRIAKVLELDWKKFKNESDREDILKLIFWIYYLDRHGIPVVTGYQKLGIIDIMQKPRIQVVSDFRKHENEIDASTSMNQFKNIIVRNLSLEKIEKIDRVIRRVNDFYNAVFNYKAKVMVETDDEDAHMLEFLNLENRLQGAIEVVDSVKIQEHELDYEIRIWEIVYLRYKKFVEICRHEESAKSLEYAIELEQPQNLKFFDTCKDKAMRLSEIPMSNLKEFTYLNAGYIAKHINIKCSTEWIKENYDRIIKFNAIVYRFNTAMDNDNCSITMLIAMYQVIYELEMKQLKYDNSYKNYRGNKSVSILAKLDTEERNSDSEAFDYVLHSLLKKWFHYNEYHHENWLAQCKMEVTFQKMLRKIMSLDNLVDMETIIEGLYIEFAFPENGTILEIKEKREKEFLDRTGYRLEIQEYGLIREFEKQKYFDWFVSQLQEVLYLNENYNEQGVFYLNQDFASLELSQNIEQKVVYFKKCKYMKIGNAFNLYERALGLHLPTMKTKE